MYHSLLFKFFIQELPALVQYDFLFWILRITTAVFFSTLLFFIFPRKRQKILLGMGLLYAVWILGIQTAVGILFFSCLWWMGIQCFDRLEKESSKDILKWVILLFSSALYFGLMNAYRVGWSLIHVSVQDLGISYLYLRVIHVTVDARWKKLPSTSLLHFFNYIFYFPTLMWGPIERYQGFYRAAFFTVEKWKPYFDRFMALRFLGGLLKIILCSTLLSLPYEELWNQTETLPYLTLVKILYVRAISFYLMASGANDLTLIASKFLQIPVCENYNYPYFRRNLAHFWKNWHMSFSSILGDYIYKPLGGQSRHQNLNYLLTFFFCAMWHVVSPAFLIWGLMHGFGMIILRTWQDFWANSSFVSLKKFFQNTPRLSWTCSSLLTFHFVALSWLPFWGGHPQGTTAILRLLKLDFLIRFL